MSEKHGNGYTGDFKRHPHSAGGVGGSGGGVGGSGERPVMSEKAAEYLREIMLEKLKIDGIEIPLISRLINEEISRIQSLGRIPQRDTLYVDIYREKPTKITAKVLVPVNEHPKFNFVGKLLGPKGSSMRQLQEETMCKMAVLGRGSMKDRTKEEELRKSLDPKYSHLTDDLHVEVSALGPPAEAYARIAFALAELRKYLIPDANDNIRQEQLRQLIERGDLPPRPPPRAGPPPHRAGPPPHRAGPPPPDMSRTVMPAKTKILSILDRARASMEQQYSFGAPPSYPPARHDQPPPHTQMRASAVRSTEYYPSYSGEQRSERHYTPAYEEEEEPYYKAAEREGYKTSARRGGGGGWARHRETPYDRPNK